MGGGPGLNKKKKASLSTSVHLLLPDCGRSVSSGRELQSRMGCSFEV